MINTFETEKICCRCKRCGWEFAADVMIGKDAPKTSCFKCEEPEPAYERVGLWGEQKS